MSRKYIAFLDLTKALGLVDGESLYALLKSDCLPTLFALILLFYNGMQATFNSMVRFLSHFLSKKGLNKAVYSPQLCLACTFPMFFNQFMPV